MFVVDLVIIKLGSVNLELIFYSVSFVFVFVFVFFLVVIDIVYMFYVVVESLYLILWICF